jgi:hypothetical protein
VSVMDPDDRRADAMGDLLSRSTVAHSITRAITRATVTSTSGPPDGPSTGYLASHTSGGTIRCSHSRPIDERTRWATSAKHIPMFKAPLATTRGGLAATVTSTSGPPDGLSTGCLASHTSGGTIRCSHSRPIDERTRWATSAKHIPMFKAPLATRLEGGSRRPLHQPRARLTA